jgi:hypothetical protein
VAPKIRHMRSTPLLPLATPKADPDKIMNKGKSSQEEFSSFVLGTTSYFPDSIFKTLVVASSAPLSSSVKISRNLNFEDLPVEYSTFSPKLKEECFEVLSSPDVVS